MENDTLVFKFPEIEQKLKKLIEDKKEEHTQKLLAEDLEKSLKAFCNSTRIEEPLVKRKLLETSKNDFIKAISEMINENLGLILNFDLRISFQRTLRLPNNGETYPLPAGLGRLPLEYIEDYENNVPIAWLGRGGVIMPIYKSEAMWMNFHTGYPFALKVGTGKIDAISGNEWQDGLTTNPQSYIVCPDQPWLDGYCVENGVVRQFVASILGDGETVEEQLRREADVGGIQLQAYPLKVEKYFERNYLNKFPKSVTEVIEFICVQLYNEYSKPRYSAMLDECCYSCESSSKSMGLSMGGKIKQEIYKDPFETEDWDLEKTSRCFVHLCNSESWEDITNKKPPHNPITAKEYKRYGIPWFDYYSEDPGVEGSSILKGLKPINTMDDEDYPFPKNTIKLDKKKVVTEF